MGAGRKRERDVNCSSFPQTKDRLMTNYLDAWLKTPWLPLYDERAGPASHCHGGACGGLYLLPV